MNVNIHLHLTQKQISFLKNQFGEKYMEILVKESIDITKKKLCVECNKWYSRTSIKRHNNAFHDKKTLTVSSK
jgi:hypothetical protein